MSVTSFSDFALGEANFRRASGKTLLLRDRAGDATKRKIVLVSKDFSIATAEDGKPGDPRISGAILQVFNAATGLTAEIEFPGGPLWTRQNPRSCPGEDS